MNPARQAQTVESPCINVCRLDETEICTGCGRTLAEIAAWPDADTPRRLEILRLATDRRVRMRSGATHE